MTALSRVRITWTGFVGAPGYTVMYCLPGGEQALADAQHTFINAIKGLFPSVVSFSWDTGDVTIDDGSGAVNGFYAGITAPAAITGTAGAVTYAAPAGVRVRWLTNDLRNHRRVSGSSYLVPSAPGAFALDGTLDSSNLATILAAAQNLVADATPDFVVWSRPTNTPPTNGGHSVVTDCRVPDKVTIRRSRAS